MNRQTTKYKHEPNFKSTHIKHNDIKSTTANKVQLYTGIVIGFISGMWFTMLVDLVIK